MPSAPASTADLHFGAARFQEFCHAQPRVFREQVAQQRLALAEGERGEVLAVALEQVEGDEHDFLAAAGLQRRHQRGEVGHAVFIEHHGLAVEQRGLAGRRRASATRPGKRWLQSSPERV